MIIGLFIAAAAVAQPSQSVKPSPAGLPVIVVPPASQMPVVRPSSRIGNDAYVVTTTPVVAVPVHVRVMGGSKELFDDTFRVSQNASGSYSENRSEAPESVCAGQRYYGSQERYSLSVNVSLRDEVPGGPMVNITVSWQRPSTMVSCGGEGSRQVQLTQTVPLAPGQSVTVQGDAGLSVTVSR